MVNKLYPDHTAIRTALWRALHVLLDAKPYVFNDQLGAKIVGEDNWRSRPDMDPDFSKNMRASIVGRARFIEDLVENCLEQGIDQYVILGAGLDTFALRRPEIASKMQIYELDRPKSQAWKQKRLKDLGMNLPQGLHFVPVNFESGASLWEALNKAGFNKSKPVVIASTGVSMYLSKEANLANLQMIAKFAPHSTLAMTFLLNLTLMEEKERATMEYVMKKAHESGTPFLSLFSPQELIEIAQSAGFKEINYISAKNIYQRYFAHRPDHLNAGDAEAFLIAST